jgi:Zn finger protein HypA/HybF involved in hydrogenase expression
VYTINEEIQNRTGIYMKSVEMRCEVCHKKIGVIEDETIFLWCSRCKKAYPATISELELIIGRMKKLENFIQSEKARI